MKKRKRFCTESTSVQYTNSSSVDAQTTEPIKRLPKAEIQELIRQEILALVKQSDDKMEELMGRIEKMDCNPKYESMINKLQADIKKIKRREQTALAYVRKLKPRGELVSPAGCYQRGAGVAPSQKPRRDSDSPVTILDPDFPTEPAHLPVESRTAESPDDVVLSSETESTNQDVPAAQKENEDEVLFCGLLLPRKKPTEARRVVSGKRVVDLTSEMEAETELNPTRRRDNIVMSPAQTEGTLEPVTPPKVIAVSPPLPPKGRLPFDKTDCTERPADPSLNSLPSRNSVSSQTDPDNVPDRQTAQGIRISAPQSNGTEPLPAETRIQDDWRSELPPLPACPIPTNLPAVAETTSLPQKPDLKVARIKNPKGIGLLWNVRELDPSVAQMDNYSLYVSKEEVNGSFSKWINIGVIKALPLPMACKVSEYTLGRRLCFTIVGKDVYGRYGPYSEIRSADSSDA